MKHKALLDKVNNALEKKVNKNPYKRTYLGASSIGAECERQLWYSFRHCTQEHITAESEKRFADGHYSEDVMAKRMIDAGIMLHTIDPQTRRQFAVSDCGGWFRGHKDGIIQQYEGEDYIWEHKSSAKWKQFGKLIEQDESTALKKWNEIYYDQAQTYMHHSGIHKHLTTCASEGTRNEVICETLYNPDDYQRIKVKAERIITSDRPLFKISEDPKFFKCNWCSAKNLCHSTEVPAPSCRNCAHITFKTDGDCRAICEKHNQEFNKKSVESMGQFYACHRFNPDLITFADVISNNEGEIAYRDSNGNTFINGESQGAFSSDEIYNCRDLGFLYDDVLKTVKNNFDATIVSPESVYGDD